MTQFEQFDPKPGQQEIEQPSEVIQEEETSTPEKETPEYVSVISQLSEEELDELDKKDSDYFRKGQW